MIVEVPLRILGLKFDRPETIDTMASEFPEIIVSGEDPDIVATLHLDATNIVAAVVQVTRELEHAIPGVKVKSVYRDFVNTSDIAHRVGVSREAVRKWAQEPTFPVTAGHLASASIDFWEWSEIVSWLLNHRNIDMGELHLTPAQKTQLDNCFLKNPDSTTMEWHIVQRPNMPLLQKRFKSIPLKKEMQVKRGPWEVVVGAA